MLSTVVSEHLATPARRMCTDSAITTLVPRQHQHGSVEVVRFEAHDVLWILAVRVGRPVLVARLRLPSLVPAIR